MVLIWSLNFSVVKYSLEEIDPLSFNAMRFLLAIIFIWVIVKSRRIHIKIQKGDWPILVFLGLWGNLMYQLLFIYGINLTYSANAAVMLGTIPVWVAVFAHFFTDDKLKLITTAGVFMAFLGVFLIMAGDARGFSISSDNVKGDIIIVMAAMVFGSYTIISRRLLDRYTPVELTTIIMTVGGGSLILVALPSLYRLDYGEISMLTYTGAVYSGLLSIGLAYVVWNYGIKQVGAVRTSAYQNLVPVFGLILGFILLGEKLTAMQYVGAAVVILGIVLSRKGNKNKK